VRESKTLVAVRGFISVAAYVPVLSALVILSGGFAKALRCVSAINLFTLLYGV